MSKGNKVFFAGLLGAIAGAIGGLLLAPGSGKETRKKISKLAVKLANEVKDEANDTKKIVEDVYGKYTEEAAKKYLDIKNAVIAKVANVKNTGKEIDKDKYQKIVEETIASFKSDLMETKEGAEKIGKYLKKDWEKVKKALV